MIAVDTSALIALVLNKPAADACIKVLGREGDQALAQERLAPRAGAKK